MNVKAKIQSLASSLLENNNKKLLFSYRSEFLKWSMNSAVKGVTTDPIADHQVVVSLTTYGKRLNEVYLTVESIMQGSLKPNRIVLWLQDDYNLDDLPQTIKNQIKRGLEVYFTKDIKSFKKLIPSLKKYPDSIIVTVDDDVLYDIDMLDRLLYSYKKNPNLIFGNCVRKIALSSKNEILPYSEWKSQPNGIEPSNLNICIGVGGVLYPPHCFSEEVFNEDLFMQLCPNADDLWFWMMAKLNGYKSAKSKTRSEKGKDFITNLDVQDMGLFRSNKCGNGFNDIQFDNLIKYFDGKRFLQ